MNYFIAIIAGIVFAQVTNLLLDYLPYRKQMTGKQIRTIKVIGTGNKMIASINRADLPSVSKIFSSVGFPFCKQCNKKTTWFTYLLGKPCEHCNEKAQKRFWIVNIVLIIGFLFFTKWPIEEFRIVDLFLLFTFYVVVFIMDVEHRVILSPVTIAGILFGLYFGITYHNLTSTITGGIVGGGIMLLFYWFGILYIRMIRKTSNPNMYEVALGFGDVTLSLILGMILGWPGIMGGLFFGIILGGIVSGLFLILKLFTKKYAPNDLILPYAPFLVIGAFVIMIM